MSKTAGDNHIPVSEGDHEKLYKYRLKLAYNGFPFCGWQIQPNGITIQEVIEDALKKLLGTKTPVVAAGRTDAGVHAKGQVAHFETRTEIDPRKLQHALNGLLPKEIRIPDLRLTTPNFHARNSAKGKIYHYYIHLDPVHDPFDHPYRWHLRYKMDIDLMRKGAAQFIGTHDFTSFANEAHKGAAAKNGVRTLKRLDIVEVEGGIRLEFEGDGFLYKMVRNIVGMLVEIATRKRSPEEVPHIMEKKDRRLAGRAAPAHGLFLMEVHYADL